MTNELALLAHWSGRQKLNGVSTVLLHRSERAFSSLYLLRASIYEIVRDPACLLSGAAEFDVRP